REEVAQVKTSPDVLAYIVDLVQATRTSPSLQTGVSPRGSTALMKTSKAWAWLMGRDFITPDDVQALLLPCLRHRVALRPEAEMDGVDVDQVLQGLLATVGCRGNVHFLPLCTTGYRRVHSHGVMAQLGNRLCHCGNARASAFGRYCAHSFPAEGKYCTQ